MRLYDGCRKDNHKSDTDMDIKELYDIFKSCSGVATDSRTIKGGELFFALKGENFDGNEYAEKALEAGAAYAVVSKDSAIAGKAGSGCPGNGSGRILAGRLIPSDNTLRTLQELARWHRSMTFVGGKPIPVIGLTGTNGKTTTKELMKAVLSVRYNVTATEENLNNSIGVPLSLLKINADSDIAIIEMGASHPGDIRELVSVCLPNFGLITNVGKAHLLGFGSFEGVKKAKGELYDYLQRTADKAFINVDNKELCKMAEERPDLQTIPYGLRFQGAEILETDSSHPFLRIALKNENLLIKTRMIGAYNADNVMAAIAVGEYMGISHADAAKAIAGYIPTNSRSQMLDTGDNTLIIDAYNANPTSMAAALDNFAGINAADKCVMLGDMLELGSESAAEHRKAIGKVESLGIATAFFVGKEFWKAAAMTDGRIPELTSGHGDTVCSSVVLKDGNGHATGFFLTSKDLASYLTQHPVKGNTILIKGSRGMRMETVIPAL